MEFSVHVHQLLKCGREYCNHLAAIKKENMKFATVLSQLNFSMNETKTKEEEVIGIVCKLKII